WPPDQEVLEAHRVTARLKGVAGRDHDAVLFLVDVRRDDRNGHHGDPDVDEITAVAPRIPVEERSERARPRDASDLPGGASADDVLTEAGGEHEDRRREREDREQVAHSEDEERGR